jgi:hypothetical protein
LLQWSDAAAGAAFGNGNCNGSFLACRRLARIFDFEMRNVPISIAKRRFDAVGGASLSLDFSAFDLRRRLIGNIDPSVALGLFGQTQINERHALELSDQD